MIIEELVTKLGLQVDSGALSTLSSFTSSISKGLGGITAVAAAAAAALTGIVTSAALAADNIGDVSEKLGVAPKALQELKFAAERAEVSFEGLQAGLKFLGKNAVEAASGNKELAKAFAGVNLKDANGKLRPTTELLAELADKFVGVPEGAERTALAMKIFGRSGSELVPLLGKGSAGIAELAAKANELGVVFSDDAVKAGGAFDDALKDVNSTLEGLRNTLGQELFTDFTDGLKLLKSFLQSLRPVAAAVGKGLHNVVTVLRSIVAGIMAVGTAINTAFGLSRLGSIMRFQTAMDIVSAVVSGLTVLAGLLGARMLLVGAQTLIAWLAAAAPFILLGILIGVLVDELYNFIEGNDTLLGRVIKWAEAFDPNGNPVLEFFKAAIALLFDFTDPAKWDRFVNGAMGAVNTINDIFITTFEFISAKIGELLGSAIQGIFNKFPFLQKLLDLGLAGGASIADAVGLGGAFRGVVNTVSGNLGFNGEKNSDSLAAKLGGLTSGLNPFRGGASGPDAVGAIAAGGTSTNSSTVAQTNNVVINAASANPHEVLKLVKTEMGAQMAKASASMAK